MAYQVRFFFKYRQIQTFWKWGLGRWRPTMSGLGAATTKHKSNELGFLQAICNHHLRRVHVYYWMHPFWIFQRTHSWVKAVGLAYWDSRDVQTTYSPVPITRHGFIIWNSSFIRPCTFSKIWGVSFNWIITQFWSTSRGTFNKTT